MTKWDFFFFLGIPGYFDIWKTVRMIHCINKLREINSKIT